MTHRNLIVYIDVDDTLVRSIGNKRIPMPNVVKHVDQLFQEGAELYLWSTGGADYAREAAEELGISHCFRAFLPKPRVLIDDQAVGDWRELIHVLPGSCEGETVESYLEKIRRKRESG